MRANMKQFDYGDMVFSVNGDSSSVALANVKQPGIFSTSTPYYNKQAMQNMNGVKVFVIPETAKDESLGKEYIVTDIAKGAFDCVSDVIEIHIPKTINKINWNFWKCSNLQRIIVDPANEKYCDIDGVLYSKNKRELIAYPNAKGEEYRVPNGVRSIGNCAFKSTKITSITMPASLRKIGVNAFYGCKQLKKILNIPTEVVEVRGIENPTGKHNINPSCHMSDGEIISLSGLTERYPRKKK